MTTSDIITELKRLHDGKGDPALSLPALADRARDDGKPNTADCLMRLNVVWNSPARRDDAIADVLLSMGEIL